MQSVRNIAIIAHVDHGKTTLVDQLLRQSGNFRENQVLAERAMDSMDLEKEKGITIKAKNASITWQGHLINIVDTPGHADFGGEVERIMKMVDGVLLVVDATDGPQAQTRFVLRKAMQYGLKVLVFINKIDREFARPMRAHDLVLELLLELNASEAQFNAPFLYGSARDGYAMHEPGDAISDMSSLYQMIVDHVPPPVVEADQPFRMVVSNLDWSDYVGRIAVGKTISGTIRPGMPIICLRKDGTREVGKVTRLLAFTGMGMTEIPEAGPGSIVGVAGCETVFIGDTLCAEETQQALPFVDIDPPTIRMHICVNDGPLAGKDGKFITSRQIGERLKRETRTNVTLVVSETDQPNIFEVSARGGLQIAVLVETMRREGFEVLVSRPEVIFHRENGQLMEPFESLWLEIPEECLGDVMQALAQRKGRITNMEHLEGICVLEAIVPTRGLIGFDSLLVNMSSGRAISSHMFHSYAPFAGEIPSRSSGALVAMDEGTATAYALDNIQERGRLFIGPGEDVYEGMVIGENARSGDLPVNPTRAKQLTNVRASGSDKAVVLEPPIRMSLERAIEFIADDEYVEVTPKVTRLRKKILNANMRKRASSSNK